MAQNRKTVFLTRCDYPSEIVETLEEKYVVHMYPHSKRKAISRDALLAGIKDADALFCSSCERIDKEVLDAAGFNLKVIATMSIGYEHIDVEECKKRNIVVCNSPNPFSVGAVAEMVIGLILGVGRKIIKSSTVIRRGEWIDCWSPTWFAGRGLMKTTVGIVGMGRIGQAVLKRLIPFDVEKIVYYDIYHPIEKAEALGAEFLPFKSLLECSDYVIATCNLTPESQSLFNASAFNNMKSTAVFINTSRGGVVEQDDLYEALKSKKIKAAALDVMYPEPMPKDHKLVSLSNVVLLPHIASAEEIAIHELGRLAAMNIIHVLEGKPPITRVM